MPPQPPAPTINTILPLIRPFQPTDTRHVRRLVGKDIAAMRSRASWQVYTNPIPLFSPIPLALLALTARHHIPSLASRSPGDASFVLVVLLISITGFVILVQRTHHAVYDRITRRTLGSEDLVNIVQYYGLDMGAREADGGAEQKGESARTGGRGVVLVLPIDNVLRGVLCIERQSPSVRQSGKGASDDRTGYVVRHLVVDLPERTRRQAANALLHSALEAIFGEAPPSSLTSTSASKAPHPHSRPSQAHHRNGSTRAAEKAPVVYAMTDPLALEGERFYHEMGFFKMQHPPSSMIDMDADSGRPAARDPPAGPRGVVDTVSGVKRLLGGVLVPKGKRPWFEISRDDWYDHFRAEKTSQRPRKG